MIAVVHHPDYVAPAPARSTYQWNKNGLIRDLLRTSEADISWHEPEPMPLEWIAAVHDPDYVAQIAAADVPREKTRRIGFPVTAQVATRAIAVPGGTYLAAKLALERGFAANSAGGSHHALAHTGAGFCIFNDLAIAAHRLIEEGAVARILIVDCDVHQGDGTAALMAGSAEIATYSIHAEKNFPVRKARSTLDVPLADGIGDDDYMAALAETLTPMLDRFRPELILYQAGVDPFEADRLGRLALSSDGLIRRERFVAQTAVERGIPLASTVGGGYGTDAMEVARRHADAILALGGVFEKHSLHAPSAFLPLEERVTGVEVRPDITRT
ncbi:histone deacetylase family protein [Stakelama marina]|uniref:Histone deacetylase n=1 Tax=Stakelama marina TaxID=2826939 RepID=A0A8T4IBS2_9SPHN|nr:histone deacetylase [Stakelama marina]MBR0551821.1 histone deacetylase [Stakelama marina]